MWDKIISALGGNLLSGVKDLVQTFKLPPEQQLQFEQKLAELESSTRLAVEKISAEDRNSARQREMAVKDKTPSYLAYLSVGGFFAVLSVQFYFAWTVHPIDTAVQRTLDISTGVLFAMVLAVKDYYFGSSKGSDDKTSMLLNRRNS